MIPVQALGWKAHAALAAGGGSARVLAPLRESIYLEAGSEIVWLGRSGTSLHPRAILTVEPIVPDGDRIWLDVGDLIPWRVELPRAPRSSADAIVRGCRRLREEITLVGVPDGLAAISSANTDAGQTSAPREFLAIAAPRARALAQACAAGSPIAATDAAIALLGLGPGLTPAGDDYVGGAFFAQALLSGAGVADGSAWTAAAAIVVERARDLTHPISVALLGDLVAGEGHAPLVDLASALAGSRPFADVLDAARRLVAIGHSSGWDMLAGFIGGVTGP